MSIVTVFFVQLIERVPLAGSHAVDAARYAVTPGQPNVRTAGAKSNSANRPGNQIMVSTPENTLTLLDVTPEWNCICQR
eukprot:586289-Rhodomonas_salina.1